MRNPPFAVTSWPAAHPRMRKITDIHPYRNNPRKHPPDQINMLAEIMKRRGVDQPIVVDEAGVILKGHGRRLAALQAGFTEYPVVEHRGLTESEKSAMRIEDNQVALLAGWDTELLEIEVKDLKLAGYDIQLLGFGDGKFAEIKPPEPTPEEPPQKPVTRPGDLWLLGGHRLLCGDATDDANWKALFGPESAAMVFTDPPYGASYKAEGFDVIEGDHKRDDDLYALLTKSFRSMVKRTVRTGAFYIWHQSTTRPEFSRAMKNAGLLEKQYLIWVKPTIAFGHADYQWQHEPCFYAARAGESPAFYADRKESTVWHISVADPKNIAASVAGGLLLLDGAGHTLYLQNKQPKGKKARSIRVEPGQQAFLTASDNVEGTVWEVRRDSGYDHPTQKPVELARRAIENSSRPGEIVADGFLGSGTTIIGAEQTGRRAYGTELDPAYCDVIVQRWEKFTGGKATLEATGQTLAEVAKARAPKGRAGRKNEPQTNVRG